MGKQADVKAAPQPKQQTARWPFDPMQPGEHQPVRPQEETKRVQKQTGAGPRKTEPRRSKT